MNRILLVILLKTVFFLSIVSGNAFDTPEIMDEFGKVKSEALESKLDRYAILFSKYPNTFGYIIIHLG